MKKLRFPISAPTVLQTTSGRWAPPARSWPGSGRRPCSPAGSCPRGPRSAWRCGGTARGPARPRCSRAGTGRRPRCGPRGPRAACSGWRAAWPAARRPCGCATSGRRTAGSTGAVSRRGAAVPKPACCSGWRVSIGEGLGPVNPRGARGLLGSPLGHRALPAARPAPRRRTRAARPGLARVAGWSWPSLRPRDMRSLGVLLRRPLCRTRAGGRLAAWRGCPGSWPAPAQHRCAAGVRALPSRAAPSEEAGGGRAAAKGGGAGGRRAGLGEGGARRRLRPTLCRFGARGP